MGWGLSPYTRGNLTLEATEICEAGSIPVHTGEPRGFRVIGVTFKVYPRTHGGTLIVSPVSVTSMGLSPYTRGNRWQTMVEGQKERSIPVHTGEPARRVRTAAIIGVYPRTHGGTLIVSPVSVTSMGLSPYTRGNRWQTMVEGQKERSIPVHTGEPARRVRTAAIIGVYPRTHGGTLIVSPVSVTSMGLSPYTRGNLGEPFRLESHHGSIPVHTGEPNLLALIRLLSKVYPRTHGGTLIVSPVSVTSMGLSPYTRGNLGEPFRLESHHGSIPVHTGEPNLLALIRLLSKVYPRTHGGT